MASRQLYVDQLKNGVSTVPSFLKVQATYTLTTSSGAYDVATDTKADPVLVSISIQLIKGQKTDVAQLKSRNLSEITPNIGEVFQCEARHFGDVVPDVKGEISIGDIGYTINRVDTDAIGLLHTFLLEKKNVFN